MWKNPRNNKGNAYCTCGILKNKRQAYCAGRYVTRKRERYMSRVVEMLAPKVLRCRRDGNYRIKFECCGGVDIPEWNPAIIEGYGQYGSSSAPLTINQCPLPAGSCFSISPPISNRPRSSLRRVGSVEEPSLRESRIGGS